MKNKFNKLLRWLKITKPIQLNKYEIQWIKLCKGHYKDNPAYDKSNWIETIKPMFNEIYGWNPDEDNNYHDYLNCIFNKLLDIHLKIQDDKSGSNQQLKEIFKQTFYKTFRCESELPIERGISELCGQIQGNIVIENGINRYYL